jgi:hypothetical protein
LQDLEDTLTACSERYGQLPVIVAGDMNVSANLLSKSYFGSHLRKFRPLIYAPYDVDDQPKHNPFSSTHEFGNCLDYALLYNYIPSKISNPIVLDMPSSDHSAVYLETDIPLPSKSNDYVLPERELFPKPRTGRQRNFFKQTCSRIWNAIEIRNKNVFSWVTNLPPIACKCRKKRGEHWTAIDQFYDALVETVCGASRNLRPIIRPLPQFRDVLASKYKSYKTGAMSKNTFPKHIKKARHHARKKLEDELMATYSRPNDFYRLVKKIRNSKARIRPPYFELHNRFKDIFAPAEIPERNMAELNNKLRSAVAANCHFLPFKVDEIIGFLKNIRKNKASYHGISIELFQSSGL